jgi:hypothetical protein
VIISQKEGKSTTIVINVIQQLVCEGEQSPRALIVEDKAKVLEMEAIFEKSKGILIWCTEYMIGAIWNMIKIISGGVDVDRDTK